MVRPLRVKYKDAYYHVLSRGRARQSVFRGEVYYEKFLPCAEPAIRY